MLYDAMLYYVMSYYGGLFGAEDLADGRGGAASTPSGPDRRHYDTN